MKAVIYTRVSTKEQAEEGFSLARQERECKEFVLKKGFSIDKVFVERGESAKTQDRTKLKELMKYCTQNKKEIDYLIVWKQDRLSRNMQDHYALNEFFQKLNIKILSATEVNDDTSVGKFTRNMLGAVAQFENDQKSERVIAGMKQAFAEGKWLWRPPLGYTKDYLNNNIMPDPKTAPFVQKAFELFSTGSYEQVQIISMLEKDGLKINANHLCRMYKNQLYCGYMVKKEWSNEPIKGTFEPIVSEKTFYQVQEILQGRKPQITPYKRNNPLFPLRQFITCPNCNQPLTGSNSIGRKSQKYSYYHCYNKDCGVNFRIPKDKLESKFVSYIKRIKPNRDILELFKVVISDVYHTNIQEVATQVKNLSKRLLELQESKSKLLDLYIDGKIKESDYNFKSEQYNLLEQSLKADMITSDLPQDDFSHCLEYACKWIEKIDKLWLDSNLDTKQRIQKIIFPKGLTYDLDKFRTAEKSSLFTIIGALSAPTIKMVLPGEFESPSPP